MNSWCVARKLPILVRFREPEGEKEELETPAGPVTAIKGEFYVVEGAKGELYPIRIDIFNETFEEIHDPDIIELVLSKKAT